MTLFFTVSLGVSVVGLILLLILKRYEMRSGKVVFMRARPRLERLSHAIVLFLHYILPFLARRSMAAILHSARVWLGATLARLTLSVEHTLARLLTAVREAVEPKRGGGQATGFLQEVADHKRRLLTDPSQKHAIFEEYQQ
jgi:hypothetical protein